VCSDGGQYDPSVRRYGVEREHIVDAVAGLVAFQDQTEELYVFYSGHGFTFQDAPDKRAVAVLVAADFESAADSGTKCIDLAEAQTKLWGFLGGRNHHYFIDACRNILNGNDIEPVQFGRKLGQHAAGRGRPARYTLYSSQFGQPADISSPFAQALVEGLAGKGRAKGYSPDGRLYVMFPLLKKFVQKRMPNQKSDDAKDGGDGYILQIQPVPTYRCTVVIEGAAQTDQFTLRRAPLGQPGFAKEEAFSGPQYQFTFTPGDLTLEVLAGNKPLERIEPPAAELLDFFDDCSVKFRKPRSRPSNRRSWVW
jgi:hypothetical protein